MAIHLICPGCAAKFSIDERLAGRAARCKNCQTPISVPQLAAALSSSYRLPPAPKWRQSSMTDPPSSAITPLGARRPDTWIDAVTSHVALDPLTAANPGSVEPILDNGTDAQPPSSPDGFNPSPSPHTLETSNPPAGPLTVWCRQQAVNLVPVFGWINQTAYLISVPLIMLFLFGVITRGHAVTLVAATVVLIVNAGPLVMGLANLMAIVYRDSPVRAILFLIPPFGVYHVIKNWQRLRNPLTSILGPAAAFGVIIVVFAFDPWLRGNIQSRSNPQGLTALQPVNREEVDQKPARRSATAPPQRAQPSQRTADPGDPGLNSR